MNAPTPAGKPINGKPINEVSEFLRPFGLGLEPVLEAIDGGKAPVL
jgi:hypothetical protein